MESFAFAMQRGKPAPPPHMWLLLFEVGLLEISDTVFVGLLWMCNRNLFRFTQLPAWQGAQQCLRQEATDCRVKYQCHRPKKPLPAGMQYMIFLLFSALWTGGYIRMQFPQALSGMVKGKSSP